MAISDTTTLNLMATYYSTLATHVAAHSALPATSGNEVIGTGSARGAITWGTAAGGVITGTATVTLPNAGGSLVALGVWSALTGGTFRDGQYDVTDVTYPSGGGTAAVTLTYTQT